MKNVLPHLIPELAALMTSPMALGAAALALFVYSSGCIKAGNKEHVDGSEHTVSTPDITHYIPTKVTSTPTHDEPLTPAKTKIESTPEPPTPSTVDKCPAEKELPATYLDDEKCLKPELKDAVGDRAIDGSDLVLNMADKEQKVLF